jgi:hypothetical protein
MDNIAKLLRAMAGGTQAKENKHDIILNAAADKMERLETSLQRIVKNKDNKNWRKPELIHEAEFGLKLRDV